jgi:two-component system, chemotaxis family, chemotaxis protein CheY
VSPKSEIRNSKSRLLVMPKKVLLVGHCGPDSSYLRMAIRKADATAEIVMADDPQELTSALTKDVDLVLFNRELGYGFDEPMGVDAIRKLKLTMPKQKTMLVSNYPDAQREAEVAGALPGFGKREIGTPRVTKLLQDALADAE